MTQDVIQFAPRYVSDYGETLVVRDRCGVKVLTDPVYDKVAVIVPNGRHATLVHFVLDGFDCPRGRDSHVVVITSNCRLGFASVRYPASRVFLQDLSEGQRVDILPTAEPAAAYVVIPRPLPVLCGAIELALPQHQYAAAAVA